jgi:hypothetical protein
MFNDILTGKASLEPPQAPPAADQSPPPRPALSPEQIAANEAASARAVREAETAFRKAESSHRLLVTCIVLFIGLALGFIRYQMRKQIRDDRARTAGYASYDDYKDESANVYPTDEYSRKVNDFARQMCSCDDLACARNVQAQYTHHLRSSAPSDDDSRTSAEQDALKLADCQEILEAGGKPPRTF